MRFNWLTGGRTRTLQNGNHNSLISGLEATTAAWFATANWFANWSNVAAVAFLLEQVLQAATERLFGSATRSWFASTYGCFTAASWLDNRTAAINGCNFATTNWFANRSTVAAAALLLEKVLQAAAELWLRSAARDWLATANRSWHFATTNWLCTTGVTTTAAKQTETGICGAANKYEYS